MATHSKTRAGVRRLRRLTRRRHEAELRKARLGTTAAGAVPAPVHQGAIRKPRDGE